MSVHEPLAAPPRTQARMPAGMTMQTAMDTPAGFRRGKANCSFCGQAWFGDVAYCPYCGRESTGAPADTRADAVARAHPAGPAHEPAPAPQAAVPPAAKQEPAGVASTSAADERTTEALADYVRSFNGKMRLFDAPAEAAAQAPKTQPRLRWKAGWMPIVTAATALALVAIAIAVKELAVTTSVGAGPQSARRAPAAGAAGSGTPGPSDRVAVPRAAPAPAPATAAVTAPVPPNRGRSASTAQAPRAPAAPHRSLCSAANEAAGLCNPQ